MIKVSPPMKRALGGARQGAVLKGISFTLDRKTF